MTTISVSESELEKIISSLLFSSSVNVTFNDKVTPDY